MKKPDLSLIPTAPGTYQFYNSANQIIYIGKAKNLKNRLSSYFNSSTLHTNKTKLMLEEADRVEYLTVNNEIEALLLEYSMIQKFKPRFNIMLKDDKSYPMLCISTDEKWPSLFLFRNKYNSKLKENRKYFGPYPSAYTTRQTIDILAKSFQIRTCSNSKFKTHQRQKSPCLLAHISMCSAPCVDNVSKEEYENITKVVEDFLKGKDSYAIKDIEKKMFEASNKQDFELATYFRDKKYVLENIVNQQIVVNSRNQSVDIFSLSHDEVNAVVVVFRVRFGRLLGQQVFHFDSFDKDSFVEIFDYVLTNLYLEKNISYDDPKEIVVDKKYIELIDTNIINIFSNKIKITSPIKGYKKELLDLALENSQEQLDKRKLLRRNDFNARNAALLDLQSKLKLKSVPLVIECFDISHIQGTDTVASMVVLKDGLPSNKDYRHYLIQHGQGNDDFLSMKEVIFRRYSNKNLTLPNLIVIDGGKGQLSHALESLNELGISDQVDIVSLAKQFEEVYKPGESFPNILPRKSESLMLLQTIRDEAHRFAITHHRKRRSKHQIESILDEIEGIGKAKKIALLKRFKSISKIKKASIEELLEVRGINKSNAQNIVDFFKL